MKNIVTPQYYAVNGAVMSINQDNLDRPGPGPGHDRNWIWTCQELDLNMPWPGSGHARTWTCQYQPGQPGQASINQDNLDIPGSGHGHARTWIWTCHDLDLDMLCQDLDLDMLISTRTTWECQELDLDKPVSTRSPGQPGHTRNWAWTCQDLNLDMPWPGPGHAMPGSGHDRT